MYIGISLGLGALIGGAHYFGENLEIDRKAKPYHIISFAAVISIPDVAENIMVSLIAGILLYVMVKEFLPEKKKGQPAFFLMGLIFFIAFQYILSFLF